MNFRLKTSAETAELLKELQSSTGLTWNILSRIAVGLSLQDPSMPPEVPNTSGVDIHRNVMTGEQDYLYKALIRQHAGYKVEETEYFPSLFNKHLERGIKTLMSEYKLAGNYDRLLTNLLTDRMI